MIKIGKKIGLIMLAGAMALSMINIPVGVNRVEASEIEVRENKESSATDDTVIIGVEGAEVTSALQSILDEINDARRQACNDGITPDPRDKSKMLQPDDFHELKIGVNCSKAAVIRAAEASFYMDHTRPNGSGWSDVIKYFNPSCGDRSENLAWTNELATNISGWLNERDAYLGKTSGQTGHYASLINPKFYFTGIASFNPSNNNTTYFNGVNTFENINWTTTAGEYAVSDTEVSSLDGKKNEVVIQKMQVPISLISDMDIDGEAILGEDDTNKFQLLVDVLYEEKDSVTSTRNTMLNCPVYDGVKWTSSNEGVVEIDGEGNITVNSLGEATITATIGNGTYKRSISRDVKVGAPEDAVVVNPKDIIVESHEVPALPKRVEMDYGNNKSIFIDVKWDDYNKELLKTTFKSKDFYVSGTAYDFSVKQKVHVKADEWSAYVYPSSVTTDSGDVPDLPKAGVHFSNDNNVDLYNMDVVWNSKLSSYCKTREGGTFNVTGSTVNAFDRDDGIKPFDVEVEVVVKKATVLSVEYNEDDITTPSGTEPTYPNIKTVTWSNGDVDTTEKPGKNYGEIIWNETDEIKNTINNRNGGEYEITGVYHDKINDVDWDTATSIKVNVLPATVTNVEFDDSDINVTNGIDPTSLLPKTAEITWSNKDKSVENISWEDIPYDNYHNMTGGEYTLDGTVAGESISIKYIVAEPEIESVEQFDDIAILEGKQPVLPQQVNVSWNNGESTKESIVWNEIDENKLNKVDESFELYGSIKDHASTANAVKIVINVEPKSLEKLEWKESPTVTDFYDNYDWSQLSGKFVASYDNETSEEIGIDDDRIESDFNKDSTDSKQIVTFSYSYENSKGKITKSEKLELNLHKPVKLGIKPPTKTEYIEGQGLDLTGLKVVKYYDDETSKTLDVSSYSLSGYDSSKIGPQTIIVSHKDLQASFSIKVIPRIASGITILNMPLQKIGMDLLTTDADAIIEYNDGTKNTYSVNELKEKGDLIISGYNSSKLGKQSLDISYNDLNTEYDDTINTSVEIEVKDKLVEWIYLSTVPAKKEYVEGMDLDISDGELSIIYDNDTRDSKVKLTDERVQISGYDMNSIGDQTIIVSVEGKTTSYIVYVKKKSITEFNCTWPQRVEYFVGQDLDLTGFTLNISYDNDTSEVIDVAKEYQENAIGNRYILGFVDGNDNKASMVNMISGAYTLSINFDNSYDDCDIAVRIPQENAVASMDESVESVLSSSLDSDSSINDIKNALEGIRISVPCLADTSVDVLVNKDTIGEISSLKEESDSELSSEEKQMLSEASAENKEVKKIAIKISKAADDKPIYTYVYIKVAKKNIATPIPVASASPTPINGKPTESPVSGETPTPDGKQDIQPSPTSDPVSQPTSTPSKDDTEDKPVPGTKVNAGGAVYTVQADNTVIYNGPDNKNITSAKVPDAVIVAGKSYPVTMVGKNAFLNCKKLKSIVIGKNVTTIGDGAFKGCINLSNVTIGANVTTIGDSAFYKCTSLKSIVIPKNVKKIGKKAFYGCKKLKKITIKTKKLKKKTIGSKAFKSIYKKASFKCPKSKVKNYKKWIKKAGAPKKAKYKK